MLPVSLSSFVTVLPSYEGYRVSGWYLLGSYHSSALFASFNINLVVLAVCS